MNAKLAAAILLAIPGSAHRLDEYLQATLIAVEKDRVEFEVRLAPGVAVLPLVLAGIDTNGDGVISESEQRVYGEQVLRDITVMVDGARLRPTMVSRTFPAIGDMKEGLGEIRFEFRADLPHNGPHRKLTFENHHQSRIAAYLVNCLVPGDPDIRIGTQNRNESQSRYELDYLQAGVASSWGSWAWLGAAALVLLTRLAVLPWRARSSYSR
jgi:hypothetical protein